MILPFILHHANKSQSTHLYKIKDFLLSHNAKPDGYDIQHIPGKHCYSCDGTGYYYHKKRCWNCINGWYKLPQWICLQRYQYGPYLFHTPIKREFTEANPWVKDEMGWEVSTNPVIEGYMEKSPSRLTNLCLTILFLRYDTSRYLSLQYREAKLYIKNIFYKLRQIKFNHRDDDSLPF